MIFSIYKEIDTIGVVMVAVGAIIYNFVASKIGGLEFEIE